MDVEELLKKRSAEINKMIEKWMPRRYNEKNLEFALGNARFRYNLEAPNRAIAEPLWNLLDRGGKRWRPVLMMLICEALGGDAKKHADFVVIPELIHEGTLCIDDIEDNSTLRRGKPCVHKIFGQDIAINAGNAMYYLPLLVLLKSKLDEKTKLQIYETYVQEMINISFGQGMDIAWHNGTANADRISEEEYLQMCAYKTGTLARMAAKIGAILAGADEKAIEKAGRFAESLGIAFQIQDDVLNLTAQSGKGQFVEEYIGEDIHEGKRTLLVIHASKKADEGDRKRLIEILNMHTNDRNLIKEAIDIIKKHDAVEYAKKKAQNLVESAWNDFEPLLREGEAKNELKALVEFSIKREF
ncbi:MAG: polyprenyl synthetase family protein [Candidatus Aenigmarchaeota archaeon]|nr:polyprenyl synthetase family protein [Candidatus Aenigmarchaeota archaeon]